MINIKHKYEKSQIWRRLLNYEIRSSVFFELWSTGGGEFGVASVKV
jgi:hypothetical protein